MTKQTIWDFWAKRYENLWVQRVSLAPTRREILIYLKNILVKDKKYKILDVGCGTGQLLRDIQQFEGYNLQLYGIDFSKEMIERGKTLGGDINYQQLKVEELEKIKDTFDIVICTHSFPYYKEQRVVLQQFRRLLKEDGNLLMAQASQNDFYDALAMFFVKFTTGSAKYPSVGNMKEMTEELFLWEKVIKIKEKFYMPSIYFFILKKGMKHEYSTN